MSFAEYRSRLLQVVADKTWKATEYDDGFKIEVPTTGALRNVIVTFIDDANNGELWARYVSAVCPANILDPEFCLRINGENRFLSGCLALRKDRLVFIDSQLASEADIVEISLIISNVVKFSSALTKLAREAAQGRGTGRFVRNRATTRVLRAGVVKDKPDLEHRSHEKKD